MNKTGLAARVAQKTSQTGKAAAEAVGAVFAAVGEALAQGETVIIVDFGRFEAVKKEARMARNPRTGEMVKVAGGRKVKFRPGKGLKELVAAPPQKTK